MLVLGQGWGKRGRIITLLQAEQLIGDTGCNSHLGEWAMGRVGDWVKQQTAINRFRPIAPSQKPTDQHTTPKKRR